MASPPTWSRDSQRIYFQHSRQGKVMLYAINRDGSDLQAIVDAPGTIGTYTFDRQQAKLVYLWGQMDVPYELNVKEMDRGRERQLTTINQKLHQEIRWGQWEETWVKSHDSYEIQGWIIKPPDFDPTQQYPALIEIHGGPLGQYGHNFMHEFHFLAAQGYIVTFCNPRGGWGYGQAHAGTIAEAYALRFEGAALRSLDANKVQLAERLQGMAQRCRKGQLKALGALHQVLKDDRHD